MGQGANAHERGVELGDVARQGRKGEVAAGLGGHVSKAQGSQAPGGGNQEVSWCLRATDVRPGKVCD